ncbi:hypothetical protein P1J78_06005 [Psychromarinibacter sp. C21-152]|uniref:Uncharacterized protein n=1 Tax=Psychromarinibacter sediminicola TaxID=3033385 RepID=A0AAE3NPX6_9RHOB|nr:hypothetical protein [Psychromarinibacter sediminicola]MDF0600276.1 hypothetical protein [Psychromarinibacter sediminicola]
MLTRRLLAAGLLSALATAAPAQQQQGKKETGPGTKPVPVIGIDGQYAAAGRNPDGSTYHGTVWIVQQGTAVEVEWSVGGDTYRGQGIIEGRVVAVDWGSDTPVVYVVMPDGALHGTWADGTALEKLTPR